jgi:hydrogenase maturation factor HypF (carbamoyltransferase family)
MEGVGFRPFVYRLAWADGLDGSVRNGPHGVGIEAEGGLSRTLRDLYGRPGGRAVAVPACLAEQC